MAQLLSIAVFIFHMAKCAFEESVEVQMQVEESVEVQMQVGKPVHFPVPAFCEADKLLRNGQLVFAYEGGVCNASKEYKGQVNETTCAFNYTRSEDAGEYELRCKTIGLIFNLVIDDQVTPTEGDPSTAGYFNTTSAGSHLNQTTPSPPLNTTQSVPGERKWTVDWKAFKIALPIVLLTVVIVIVALLGLRHRGWFLKTRCCPRDPPGPGGVQYTAANGEINVNVPDEMDDTQV